MSKKIWIIGGLVLALVVAGSVTAAVLLLTGGDDDTSRADDGDDDRPTNFPAELEEFYTQELDWDSCGRDECATLTVPVDYADPDGETTELQMRLVGDVDADRHLLVNPGGPGGSAMDYATSMSRMLGDDVLEEFAVVGVDPRGVGESSPLECFDDETFDEYVDADPSPDDEAELDESYAWMERLGEACGENSGALAGHVSTVEVARDMDIARAVLGDELLNWFGASYGTRLGATYAGLFPENVGVMVLDGAINPEIGAIDSAMGQIVGFQRALEAYLADCTQSDDCPLGTDPVAAEGQLVDLLAALDVEPMPTSDRDRPLTEGEALFGLALPLYNEASWPALTDALEMALVDGDGSGLQYLSDLYFERDDDGSYASNIGQVITAVNCLDEVDPPTLEEVQARMPEFVEASPVFGPALGIGSGACAAWPFTSEADPVDFTAEGAPPILVLGTTRDPATPYEEAVQLAELLDSGVLITRDGDGHTAYQSGNRCVTDVVDEYLLTGKVPKNDPGC